MTAVAWVLWLGGMLTTGSYLVIRITGLDERRLRAIQASSFGFVPVVAALPSLVLDALVAFGLVDVARQPPAAVLVVAVLAYVVTRITNVVRSPPTTATGARLCIATVNVEWGSRSAEMIGRQLRGVGADLLLIQEYTPRTADGCRTAGLHDDYAYRAENPQDGNFGYGLFSHHPVADWQQVMVGGRPMVSATLDLDGRRVTVFNVHVQAPTYRRDVEPWRTSFVDLGHMTERNGGPSILAGDWNAVPAHAPLRRMLRRHGLVDAHLARARWRWPRTWPTNLWWLPPMLCLDHVVVTPDIAVLAIREERVAGTDHKAVIAHLQLPQEGRA